MTVPVQTPYTASTANGVTTTFPYSFKIASEDDLVVEIDGVNQTSGYTVTGVGNTAGGNVEFSVAPDNGAKVLRYLKPILKRENDFQQFGDWNAATINSEFDRIWLALQTQQQNDLRAVKLPVDTSSDQLIPEAAAARANMGIGFDALGALKLYVLQAGSSLIDLGNTTNMLNGVALIGGAGRVVDSIAALRALPKTGSKTAFVLGYYAKGDEGGGAYYYDASDTTSSDNGGTIIVADDGGRWKLAGNGAVTLQQFGAKGDGTTNDTAAVTAALIYANTSKRLLKMIGNFKVTNLQCSGFNGLYIYANCTIIGTASASGVLWDWLNCSDVTIDGRINLTGGYNTNYTCGWWQRTSGSNASQYFNVSGLALNAIKLGVRIGDATVPDAIISETTYNLRYFYGCPNPVQVEGTQTVVNFVGSHIIANHSGGDAGWQALTQTTLRVIGSAVLITGGELQHAQTTTGQLIDFQPITSGASALNGTVWGQVRVINAECETAAPLVITSNPGALGSPVTKGLIEFVGCAGAHTQDLASFITTDSTYEGDVVIDNACRFFKPLGSTRTQVNVTCGNNACNVIVGEQSFGKNFVQGLLGISGGTVRFTHRMVLDASNVNGQVVNAGASSILLYTTTSTAGDLGRFTAQYSAATGKFTVPSGGLKDVHVLANISKAGLTGCVMYVYLNGTNYGNSQFDQNGQVDFYFKSLSAGDTVWIQLLNQLGAPITLNAHAIDRFQIFASN